MELTQKQSEILFAFTEKKFVKWYDLQVELVDHLAERIGEEMTANPKLDFNAALEKVYAGFGIFGFYKIVQAREEAMRKRHNRLWLQAIWQQFSWPVLLRTIAIFMVCRSTISVLEPGRFVVILFLLIAIAALVATSNFRRKYKTRKALLILQNWSFPLAFIVLEYPLATVAVGQFLFPTEHAAGFLYRIPGFVLAGYATLVLAGFLALYSVYKAMHATARRQFPDVFVMAD